MADRRLCGERVRRRSSSSRPATALLRNRCPDGSTLRENIHRLKRASLAPGHGGASRPWPTGRSHFPIATAWLVLGSRLNGGGTLPAPTRSSATKDDIRQKSIAG